MIRTLLWKDLREQQLIWVIFAILGAGVSFSLLATLTPPGSAFPDSEKGLVLAIVAGVVASSFALVSGAMLLAGEVEERTLAFLDGLSGRRWPVWRSKCLLGAWLSSAMAAALAILFALELRWPNPWVAGLGSFGVLLAIAMEAYGWGLFFSARQTTVLGAAWRTAVTLLVLWLVTAQPFWGLGILLRAVLVPTTFWLSRRWFCGEETRALGGWRSAGGWQVVLWLTLRQARWPLTLAALVLPVLGFFFAPVSGYAWPAVTLAIGLACGVSAFAGEQTSGATRFLGDQRMPLGRFWMAKILGWLFVAGVVALFFAIGNITGALANLPSERDRHESTYEYFLSLLFQGESLFGYQERGLFLILWLIYGFACGQFFSICSKKPVVAGFLAVILAIATLDAWQPSIICGGVSWWQVLVTPMLLLLATRLALRAWTSGRLGSRAPVLQLVGLVLLAIAWIPLNVAARLLELPDIGEPFDVAKYVASFPSPEANTAGRLLRQAADQYAEHANQVTAHVTPPTRPLFPPESLGNQPMQPPAEATAGGAGLMAGMGSAAVTGPAGDGSEPIRLSYQEQLQVLLERGWPKERTGKSEPELARWLDAMVQGAWVNSVRQAVDAPRGVVEDARNISAFDAAKSNVLAISDAAAVLAGDALLLQARGKPGDGLERLIWTFAISEHLQHKAYGYSVTAGQGAEAIALDGLSQWRKRVGRQPDLLKRALGVLETHEAAAPDPADPIRSTYLVYQNSVNALMTRVGTDPRMTATPQIRILIEMWRVPYERERRDRIASLLFAGWLRAAEQPALVLPRQAPQNSSANQLLQHWIPPQSLLAGRSPTEAVNWMEAQLQQQPEYFLRFLLGFAPARGIVQGTNRLHLQREQVQIARQLYLIQEGKPAQTVKDLVPKYLKKVPAAFRGDLELTDTIDPE